VAVSTEPSCHCLVTTCQDSQHCRIKPVTSVEAPIFVWEGKPLVHVSEAVAGFGVRSLKSLTRSGQRGITAQATIM
jgi:hypothetical protein